MLIDNTKEKPTGLKAGVELKGELEYAVPEDNSRALNVSMTWKVDAEKENSQSWKMR